MTHERFMLRAIELAKKAVPSPNPPCGAVVVRNDEIIGEGYHERAGGLHAEAVAIKDAGDCVGATLYVTLEPCVHSGKTGPCCDLIISSGITQVIVGILDENPVATGGIAHLRREGILVLTGVCAAETRRIYTPFFTHVRTGMPFVHLKAALTIDGKIAPVSRQFTQLSCDESQKMTHELRSCVDAILVGSGTIKHDNPRLTCRREHTTYPIRVVLDGHDVSPESKVFTLPGEAILITTDAARARLFESIATVIELDSMKPEVVLQALGERGILSVLVEGGSAVFTSFIEADLVDMYHFIVTPIFYGTGIPVYAGKEARCTFSEVTIHGTDVWITAGRK